MFRYNNIYNNTVPIFHTLLKEIFWMLLSMCEKEDILNLRLVCRTINEKIFVPIYPPLCTFPFVSDVLDIIERIEIYETNSSTIKKYTPHVSSILNKFPEYFNVLYNIVDYSRYIEYSPTFWYFDGKRRVKKLKSSHDIHIDNKRICFYTKLTNSIGKDRFVSVLITCTLSIASIFSWWYIYNLYGTKTKFLLSEKFLLVFLFAFVFFTYIVVSVLVVTMLRR